MSDSTSSGNGAFLFQRTIRRSLDHPSPAHGDSAELTAAMKRWLEAEVRPQMAQLDTGDRDLLRQLLQAAGRQGYFAPEFGEEWGGLNLPKSVASDIAETLGAYGSFMVAFSAHAGIGSLPLAYFGSAELKARYLPRLVRGEALAAYCLSEPGSGSDAQAARCAAAVTPDGRSYVLKGSKAWVTNGGIADLYTVFCQIKTAEGPRFSALLVERNSPGLVVGADEHKMGLRGSSTTTLSFDDVHVPSGNLLGTEGDGARIAFNILNIGRYKLAASAVGAGKRALVLASGYATERRAFGRPIGEFELIRDKLGSMASKLFAAQQMVHRLTRDIDAHVHLHPGSQAGMRAAQAFAMEASIVKVFASEALDESVDHAVQIHGGSGFSAEYEVERLYRDARINRIFEGTNEINRLLIATLLAKRTAQASSDSPARIEDWIERLSEFNGGGGATGRSSQLKDLALWAAQALSAMQASAGDAQPQCAMAHLADIVIHCYAVDAVAPWLGSGDANGSATSTAPQIAAQIVHEEARRVVSSSLQELSATLPDEDHWHQARLLLESLEPTRPISLSKMRCRLGQPETLSQLWLVERTSPTPSTSAKTDCTP